MTSSSEATGHHTSPPLGSWGRADGFLGVVAQVDDGHVTLFDPAGRRQHRVPAAMVARVPAAAVRVTVTVDLPLAHGLDERDLRRWTAMLTDPLLRERAHDALTAAGLDAGAALPQVTITATAHADGRGRCLCGATSPSAATTPGDADPAACPACGRHLAPPAPLPAT